MTGDFALHELCIVACAEAWRGDGEILASPFGTLPAVAAATPPAPLRASGRSRARAARGWLLLRLLDLAHLFGFD